MKLMIQVDYGTDEARKRARAYLENHGGTKRATSRKSRRFI